MENLLDKHFKDNDFYKTYSNEYELLPFNFHKFKIGKWSVHSSD